MTLYALPYDLAGSLRRLDDGDLDRQLGLSRAQLERVIGSKPKQGKG